MESTNQGIPLGGNPSPLSSWGDIGSPYMATLSLLGITIGLLVWLFSTSVIHNTVIPQQSNQQPDDTEVTPSPSTSFVSPSTSSSSLGETSDTKNQVAKKKKKGKEKKKKPAKQGNNNASSGENSHIKVSKPKNPCVICKEIHYHQDFPCIPQILREWSPRLHHSMSSTSDSQVDSTPSTSENEVNRQKGKVRVPCRLCEGDHTLHCFPFLDEAKSILDTRPASPQQLPPRYKKLLPSPSLVENLIDITQLSIESPIIECEPPESTSDQSQLVKMAVNPVLPSKGPPSDDTVSKENENDTIQILFVDTESNELGGNPPISLQQEETQFMKLI